jgi:hypothetical protein
VRDAAGDSHFLISRERGTSLAGNPLSTADVKALAAGAPVG